MNALPTRRAGQILALGLLLLMIALAWAGVAAPLAAWYGARAEALREQAALVAHQAALAGELPELEAAARAAPATAPAAGALLGGATDAIAGATLEQRLQALAGRIGASLTSAEALPPVAQGGYDRIALKITLASDWPTLINFLKTVTTGQPTMLVDDLSLTGPTIPQPGVPPISAIFTVIAFRAAGAPPADAAPAAAP